MPHGGENIRRWKRPLMFKDAINRIICPVCGKQALLSYTDETKKVVAFKHQKKLKSITTQIIERHAKIVETTYCEVPY